MHINTKTKTQDMEILQLHGFTAGSGPWNALSLNHLGLYFGTSWVLNKDLEKGDRSAVLITVTLLLWASVFSIGMTSFFEVQMVQRTWKSSLQATFSGLQAEFMFL